MSDYPMPLMGAGPCPVRSLCQCQVGSVQMSLERCPDQAQAWETTRLGRWWRRARLDSRVYSGTPGQVSMSHVVITSVPQPYTTGSNWMGPALFRIGKDPSPCCSEPTGGLGTVRGPGDQRRLQAPQAPVREEAGSSHPCPDSLSRTGPGPLSPAQLWLLVLQEVQLDRASWMLRRWRPHNGQDCGVWWWAGLSSAV